MEFILRPWQSEDAESVTEVANNKKIAMRLRNVFPHPYTLEDAKWFVNDCITKGDATQYLRAIVVDGKAVGSIGVYIQNDVYEKSGELGYWLGEEYWGKGIMSAAIDKLCGEVFEKYDIERIFVEPFATNVGSRKVLEKNGFIYEGTMRKGVYKDGEYIDYCMYSKLREEIDGLKKS